MNIILGATGQVGSMLAMNLLEQGQPVRAVVRNEDKAYELEKNGAEIVVADYFDKAAIKKAFQGGESVFLLTPENPFSENYLDDIRLIIQNFQEAIQETSIRKIVGLSSMGAHHQTGTGTLMASYLLEHAFNDHNVDQTFVRPSYYYSNWVGYLELMMSEGILPTFFPAEMKIPMIAPKDVAACLTDIMIQEAENPQNRVVEISGPYDYNSLEIAEICSNTFQQKITLERIESSDWENALKESGFTSDGINNLIQMTRAVIDGKTKRETDEIIRLNTDFKTFLKQAINL